MILHISCIVTAGQHAMLDYTANIMQNQKKKTTNKTKLNNAKNQTKEFIGGLKNINVLACRLSVRQIFDVESMLLFQLNLNLTLDQCYIFNV